MFFTSIECNWANSAAIWNNNIWIFTIMREMYRKQSQNIIYHYHSYNHKGKNEQIYIISLVYLLHCCLTLWWMLYYDWIEEIKHCSTPSHPPPRIREEEILCSLSLYHWLIVSQFISLRFSLCLCELSWLSLCTHTPSTHNLSPAVRFGEVFSTLSGSKWSLPIDLQIYVLGPSLSIHRLHLVRNAIGMTNHCI